VAYGLLTGANWKALIGAFRLVVDRAKLDSLVSFCAEANPAIADLPGGRLLGAALFVP
jgi:hypothetical protein